MGWAAKHIEQLKAGQTIQFRPNGSSMRPIIEPGQLCTVEPTSSLNYPMVGDVVLCVVKGQEYFHLVSAMRGGQVEIRNNRGYSNGWIPVDQVFGRLIQIEP